MKKKAVIIIAVVLVAVMIPLSILVIKPDYTMSQSRKNSWLKVLTK